MYNKMYYMANNPKIADKKRKQIIKKVQRRTGLTVQHKAMEEKEEDLDGEIITAHLTIVILLIIITK